MEFVPGGSVSSIINRFGPLLEKVSAIYTKQILEGVDYLHNSWVSHRYLKGNVVLMPTGIIKLIDFGCAKRLHHELDDYSSRFAATFFGVILFELKLIIMADSSAADLSTAPNSTVVDPAAQNGQCAPTDQHPPKRESRGDPFTMDRDQAMKISESVQFSDEVENRGLLESSTRLKPHEAQSYRKKALWVSWASILVTIALAVAAFSDDYEDCFVLHWRLKPSSSNESFLSLIQGSKDDPFMSVSIEDLKVRTGNMRLVQYRSLLELLLWQQKRGLRNIAQEYHRTPS
ncbi:M3K19 kinase, partial [Polyodon spathula]|nr:M3K19 kinase [Polyodon spathula]